MHSAALLLLLLFAGGALAQRIEPATQAARDSDGAAILRAELEKEKEAWKAAVQREDTRAADDHARNVGAIANELKRASAAPAAAPAAPPTAPAAPKRAAMSELERKLSAPVTVMRTQQAAVAPTTTPSEIPR